MMFVEFWDYVLDPIFLITFGLTGAFFLPMVWSIWVTWRDNTAEED